MCRTHHLIRNKKYKTKSTIEQTNILRRELSLTDSQHD